MQGEIIGVKCIDCKGLVEYQSDKSKKRGRPKEKFYGCKFVQESFIPETVISKPLKCKFYCKK